MTATGLNMTFTGRIMTFTGSDMTFTGALTRTNLTRELGKCRVLKRKISKV